MVLMQVSHAVSPNQDPVCYLENWQVMETDRGTRHFIGCNIALGTGRVSIPIVSFDHATGQGVTASVRIYELVGVSGIDERAMVLWRVQCTNAGETSANVSSEYVAIARSV